MKKFYEAPDMEASKFTLAADVLAESDPEGDLGVKEGTIGGSGSGFSWP